MQHKPKGPRAPRTVIERDFHDALDRLFAGKPSNPKLKRMAAEGRLQINIAAVAAEAGRARTLIAHEKCQYPAIRARVIDAMRKDELVAPRSASEVIMRLRQDIADLRGKLAAALDGQAAHFLARQKAERDAESARAAHRRVERQRYDDAKVTPIRP